jgi:3-hydroxybutyryl-CoA dehydrogenase
VTHSVTTIGVVGAGTMGTGIALAAASSGFAVQLIDAEDEFIDRGLKRIAADLDKAVNRGKVQNDERDTILGRITGSTDYTQLEDCELVIEAVPETLAIKEPVLAAIAESVGGATIIASNTSSLSIHDLSTYVSNPERVVGMHFFNPVSQMNLVEVVASDTTSEDALKTVTDVAETMGKTPVLSADRAGFIVNRVLIPMINEAILVLEDGVATAEDIDTAMKLGAAHPMGPLALADLIGLDVVLAILQVLEQAFGEKYAPATLLVDKVGAGELGRKSGNGFFSYSGGKQ